MNNRLMTDAEAEIMEYIWQCQKNGQLKFLARDIYEHFPHKCWRIQTVNTFLKSLYNKEILNIEQYKNKYYYIPIITREEYANRPVEEAYRTFSFFGGGTKNFLSSFIGSVKIKKDEIDELREWINSIDIEDDNDK